MAQVDGCCLGTIGGERRSDPDAAGKGTASHRKGSAGGKDLVGISNSQCSQLRRSFCCVSACCTRILVDFSMNSIWSAASLKAACTGWGPPSTICRHEAISLQRHSAKGESLEIRALIADAALTARR